jgi:predicted nucleic acid-binding Zn ribbon protein
VSRLCLPENIREVLSRAIGRSKLRAELKKFEFKNHWKTIVGDQIASHAKPAGFRGNSLIVQVDSSVWAQELSFQKSTILKRIQRFVPENNSINDIIFSVGK